VKRAHGLETLPEALAWVEKHWSEQPAIPLRLHEHGVQPADLLGAPRMTAAFWRYLNLSGNAIESVSVTQACYHPRPGDPCPDCWNDGVVTVTRERFSYPMRAALEGLTNDPAAYAVVVRLAQQGWQLGRLSPERALTAIRKLYNRFSTTPIGRVPKWTELSESSQRALTMDVA
jgi:hypothetical protein